MQQGTGLIVISLLVLFAVLFGVHRFLATRPNSALQTSKGWIYALVSFLGLAIIFALLPIESSAKNNVFSLLGLVVTAVIAISSTTFASNAMAGIMLRMIKHFKPGDFIEVGEHFGRVSEMELLHTEIQTKNRNLTTLPNLFLVTNPVTVIPQDKVLVSADLSLGYDVSHHDVERILKSAARQVDLSDAFVQVTNLGDFSISYRVSGFLADPKLLLSARSNLRKQVIDSLHANSIEIVSPTFMNQRQYNSQETFISEVKAYQARKNRNAEHQSPPVFDKAEAAETVEKLKNQLKALSANPTHADTPLSDDDRVKLVQQKSTLIAEIQALANELDIPDTEENTTSSNPTLPEKNGKKSLD